MRRRLLVAAATVAAAVAATVGSPFEATADAAAPPPAPGETHSETFLLTATGTASRPVAATEGRTVAADAPSQVAPGWKTSIDVTDGTQAIGPTWTGAPDGVVSVRGRVDGDPNGWGPWQPLEAEAADKQADSDRDAGGIAWFGLDGVDEVELRVDAGTLTDLQVQAIRTDEPETTADPPAGAARTAAGDGQPTINLRSSWTTKGWAYGNSGCSSGPKYATGGAGFAIVHHTVNSNTYAAADVPAMLASIYAYHTGSQGWCDIAYNFVVDRFGRIWEGRSGGIDKAVIGGHASGFNTGSFGVSFLGQFHPGATPAAVEPTSAAIDAAGRLIGWKLSLGGFDALSNVTVTSGGGTRYPAGTVVTIPRVSAHRDVGQTACPGNNLYDDLGAIRLIARSVQTTPTTTTTTTTPTTTTTAPPPPPEYAPFASAGTLVTQQYRDVLHRDPSSADLSYWSARVGNSWTPGQFVASLVISPEADNRAGSVVRLYRAYFLRTPDHSGLTYWLNRRGEGRTLASIAASFADSAEFRNRYGALGDAAFVNRVYLNVMGRPADAGGSSYWTRQLQAGTSRGQVMASFSQSTEYIARTDPGTRVVLSYESMLDRAADPAAYDLYEDGLRNATTSVTALTTAIWNSNEYQTRF